MIMIGQAIIPINNPVNPAMPAIIEDPIMGGFKRQTSVALGAARGRAKGTLGPSFRGV